MTRLHSTANRPGGTLAVAYDEAYSVADQANFSNPRPVEAVESANPMTQLPVTIARGGTSRGVLLRAEDLPADPASRTTAILRLFGGERAMLADGLGGEHPVLRKAAILAPAPTGPDGIPGIAYTFGQVDAALQGVSHSVECGNVAAAVPLFGTLEGWLPEARVGDCVRLDLSNTAKTVLARWLVVEPDGRGTVDLSFVRPAPSVDDALSLGERASSFRDGSVTIRFTAFRSMNAYVFVDALSLGIDRLSDVDSLSQETFAALASLIEAVRERSGASTTPKVCLVAPCSERRSAVSGLVVYPQERRLHRTFPVTGAVDLAVATCVEGTVPQGCLSSAGLTSLEIVHPSGVLALGLEPGGADVPERVRIERDYRLLLRGLAS